VNYGQQVSFKGAGCVGPLPVALSSSSAHPGDEIVITGTNFSYVPFRNVVSLGNIMTTVTKSTDSTVTFTLPEDITPGSYQVSIKVADRTKTVPGTLQVDL